MTLKATAVAPANIAFVKYWGKRSARLNTPFAGSLSMNLSEHRTTTTVQFGQLNRDEIVLDGRGADVEAGERAIIHLDRIRRIAGMRLRARVTSRNNFPTGVGIASSASGFAALTLAAASALGLRLSEKKLSTLARRGSGSACRSIPDGFVEWLSGTRDADSYAYSLYPPDYWDIRDVVVIVSKARKRVGSTGGHALARSSPFFMARVRRLPSTLQRIKQSLEKKQFSQFGTIIESEALNMHAVMLTSSPALIYWEPATVAILLRVREWREEGLESYFTLDAGPTVHVICREPDAERLSRRLQRISGVLEVVVNRPAEGARVVKEDLF